MQFRLKDKLSPVMGIQGKLLAQMLAQLSLAHARVEGLKASETGFRKEYAFSLACACRGILLFATSCEKPISGFLACACVEGYPCPQVGTPNQTFAQKRAQVTLL